MVIFTTVIICFKQIQLVLVIDGNSNGIPASVIPLDVLSRIKCVEINDLGPVDLLRRS